MIGWGWLRRPRFSGLSSIRSVACILKVALNLRNRKKNEFLSTEYDCQMRFTWTEITTRCPAGGESLITWKEPGTITQSGVLKFVSKLEIRFGLPMFSSTTTVKTDVTSGIVKSTWRMSGAKLIH